MECVPAELAKTVTESINIPTIGIGAGVDCDGQVLVLHDTMGMFEKFIPKFVKIYAQLNVQMKQAVSQYIDDVRKGTFPEKKHSF
ncbi:MAG: 3-methyl-2-oxobutanoate hydroxymethyltransferase [Syntrophales bacterium]